MTSHSFTDSARMLPYIPRSRLVRTKPPTRAGRTYIQSFDGGVEGHAPASADSNTLDYIAEPNNGIKREREASAQHFPSIGRHVDMKGSRYQARPVEFNFIACPTMSGERIRGRRVGGSSYSGRWISCIIRGAIGYGARTGVRPLPTNSTTPRGESSNMVLDAYPCESRKRNDVVCIGRRSITRQIDRAGRSANSLRFNFAVRGVKPTGGLFIRPVALQSRLGGLSDVFEYSVLHAPIITHGVFNVVPFNPKVFP